MFATNGREFLEQLRTMSGIWFCDLRRAENISRPLKNWYSPEDLIDTLAQDLDRSQQQLESESFEYNFSLQVHIATIQGMLKRLLYPADDTPTLTAGQYDCIIVDECHRGYLLVGVASPRRIAR